MKPIFLAFIIISFYRFSAQNCSADIEEQIRQVENNLSGRVRLSSQGYNIIERMAFYKVKGLSLAVINNYKIAWAKGYGWADEKEKRPVTIHTLFQAASNSKSLNAAGVLKLVQDGKLDLFTDINKYLKSWQFPYDSVSKNKKITLANLLSHTAGLNAVNFPGYNRKSRIPTIPQILDGKTPANTPPVRSEFEPGLRFQYSGGGTTISRLIISDVTQQPYDKFMYDNVLKPLEMVNSFFTQPPPASKLRLLAAGYHSDGSRVKNKFNVYPEQGADGLWTTPSEMCNYIIETQLACEGKSSKVLNPEMARLHLTPYLDEASALGVFIQKRGNAVYFTHGAGNEGFSGQYYGSLTGGKGVVVYINSDNRAIINEVVNSVAKVYGWEDFCDTTVRKVIELPDSIGKKYVGVYFLNDKLATIFKNNDGYYYRADNDNLKMYFTSEVDFFNQESLSDKTFNISASGEVIGFSRNASGRIYPPAVKLKSPDSLRLENYEFGNIAWQFFENGRYDDAISYCRRGLQLYSNDEGLLSKIAHAYLFNNEYDNAVSAYKKLKEILKPESKWEKTMQQTLVYFKNNGYDVTMFNRLFSDLKIKKPKGY